MCVCMCALCYYLSFVIVGNSKFDVVWHIGVCVFVGGWVKCVCVRTRTDVWRCDIETVFHVSPYRRYHYCYCVRIFL